MPDVEIAVFIGTIGLGVILLLLAAVAFAVVAVLFLAASGTTAGVRRLRGHQGAAAGTSGESFAVDTVLPSEVASVPDVAAPVRGKLDVAA